MKKNFTKFLLALLVVGGGFQSCKKADADLQKEKSLYEFPLNEQNTILDELAKTVAKSLTNKEFRALIKSEALKKVDGDFDIHYADLAKQSINEFAISEVMESNTSFGKKGVMGINTFNQLSKTVPNFQLSVPVNIKKWDTDQYEPLVTYMPVGVNDIDVKEMRAFDSKGNLHILDGQTPPDFPVIVIGSSERRDENGDVLSQFSNNTKKMIQPIDDVDPGGGGGSGGGSGGGTTSCSLDRNIRSTPDKVTYAKFKTTSRKRFVEPWGNGDAEVYFFYVWVDTYGVDTPKSARSKVHTDWGNQTWFDFYVKEIYFGQVIRSWEGTHSNETQMKYEWFEKDSSDPGTGHNVILYAGNYSHNINVYPYSGSDYIGSATTYVNDTECSDSKGKKYSTYSGNLYDHSDLIYFHISNK